MRLFVSHVILLSAPLTSAAIAQTAWAQDAATRPTHRPDHAADQVNADPQTSRANGEGSPQAPVAPALSSTSVVDDAASAKAKFARFDALMEPGFTSTFPGSADSILQDTGGFRSWLADRDIGLRAIVGNVATLNVLPTGQPRDPQRYNGQRFTLQTQSANATLAFGLGSIGLPNTKFFVGGAYLLTSFDPNGPNTAWLRSFGIYQTFANGRITVKAGVTPNYYEYVGLFTGGSPVLASGLGGLLPIQAGLGADPAATPLINVTVYGTKGKYVRFGVQRSTSVLGIPAEVAARGVGFKFGAQGAGPLYISEFGIRRPASAEGRQIWLRVGGFYNDSRYRRFDGTGTRANASLYALADRQLTQPDKSRPARGFYAGASAFWIPKEVNTFTQSYELRAYSIGALASRPQDTAALRATYSQYSGPARAANEARGLYANPYQLNITASYSTHLGKGIYLTPGLSYIRHPSFIGDFNDALVASTGLYLIL